MKLPIGNYKRWLLFIYFMVTMKHPLYIMFKRKKQMLKKCFQLLQKAGVFLSLLVNSLLLSLIYFSAVGLTSFAAKIAGKKFLDTQVLKNKHTYWKNAALQETSLEGFQRMF